MLPRPEKFDSANYLILLIIVDRSFEWRILRWFIRNQLSSSFIVRFINVYSSSDIFLFVISILSFRTANRVLIRSCTNECFLGSLFTSRSFFLLSFIVRFSRETLSNFNDSKKIRSLEKYQSKRCNKIHLRKNVVNICYCHRESKVFVQHIFLFSNEE